MDSQADKTPFSEMLDGLCSAWNRPPASSEMQQAYWQALKDVRLSEVRRNIERILRTATGKAPFPKPAELRNEAPRELGGGVVQFQSAETFCIQNLEELRRVDNELWQKTVRLRWADRLLASEPPYSIAYAEAYKEAQRLRPLVRGY